MLPVPPGVTPHREGPVRGIRATVRTPSQRGPGHARPSRPRRRPHTGHDDPPGGPAHRSECAACHYPRTRDRESATTPAAVVTAIRHRARQCTSAGVIAPPSKPDCGRRISACQSAAHALLLRTSQIPNYPARQYISDSKAVHATRRRRSAGPRMVTFAVPERRVERPYWSDVTKGSSRCRRPPEACGASPPR